MPGSITIGRNAYNTGWRGGKTTWAINAELRFNKPRIHYSFMNVASLDEVTRRLRTTRPDVFLSHKQEDIDSALLLAECLSIEHNLDVYLDVIDPSVNPNDQELDDYLRAVIRSSISLLVAVSDNTRESWWVPFEIGVACELQKLIGTFPISNVKLPTFLERWWIIGRNKTIKEWASMVQISAIATGSKSLNSFI